MPVLLRSRPVPLQLVLAVIVPALFGAVAGWLLGVSEIGYLVISIVALGGGFFAGLEHRGAGEGAIRGVLGGALFGAVILAVHHATGKEPKAELPHPEVVLVVITALIGTVLGALGGKRRAKHEGDMAEAKQEEQQQEQEPQDEKAQKAKLKEQRARDMKSEDQGGFSLRRLHWAELVGFAGAGVLAGSLFLKWFGTDCITLAAARAGEECNKNSIYNGRYGEFSAFQTFKYLDWLLVAACVAPFILAYIIARGHALSWKPGEVTMIVGMIAFALILLNGIILGKPGDTVDMHFEIGWLVGLIGSMMIMLGGILRQSLAPSTKTPPGVM